jgi:ATP-dependent Clp protease ATP-binding subunit ClpB
VDFKNTIVIMTSNLGSPIIQEYFMGSAGGPPVVSGGPPGTRSTNLKKKSDGEDFGEPPKSARERRALPTELEEKVMAELKRHFRPEFLNRVDDVIIFQSLDESELSRIVDIQLEKLKKRLAQQQLTLDVDAAAKKLLASEGYDPQFGARPLKRAVQEHILNPLSLRLLEGEFKPGDKIKVTAKNDELVFEKK